MSIFGGGAHPDNKCEKNQIFGIRLGRSSLLYDILKLNYLWGEVSICAITDK